MYDPFISSNGISDLQVEMTSFDELIKQADYITIHTPLTPETKHLFDEKAFQKMKKGGSYC